MVPRDRDRREAMQPDVEIEDGRSAARRKLRPVGIKRIPMKRVFAGAYLDQDRRPRKKLRNNSDVTRYLLQQSLLDLGEPIREPSPEGDEKIAKMMAAEVVAAIARPGSSSVNWYSHAIERAIAIASVMHPEIASDEAARAVPGGWFKTADDARIVFLAATAITSQNVVVRDNIRYALKQYRHFLAHGTFQVKGYGAKAQSVKSNLARFNQMLDIFDRDIHALGGFLDAEFTMKELRDVGRKYGVIIGGKELADEVVHGSMLFGPKIGNGFYQNLRGNLRPVTIDLWFARTWGRYTATLIKGEVTEKQVQRLANSLRDLPEAFMLKMREDGIEIEPDGVPQLDQMELLDLGRALTRFWERMRKAMAREGETNEQLSLYKARLDWPGAAEAVVQGLAESVDAPTSGGMRRWIRSVVDRSLHILESNGIEMNAADLQATLWYPEKDLYQVLLGRNTSVRNDSYDDALYATARREGHDHAAIEAALRSLGAHGFVGRWDPKAFGPGEPGAAERNGPGSEGDREEPAESDLGEEVGLSEGAYEEPFAASAPELPSFATFSPA